MFSNSLWMTFNNIIFESAKSSSNKIFFLFFKKKLYIEMSNFFE